MQRKSGSPYWQSITSGRVLWSFPIGILVIRLMSVRVITQHEPIMIINNFSTSVWNESCEGAGGVENNSPLGCNLYDGSDKKIVATLARSNEPCLFYIRWKSGHANNPDAVPVHFPEDRTPATCSQCRNSHLRKRLSLLKEFRLPVFVNKIYVCLSALAG